MSAGGALGEPPAPHGVGVLVLAAGDLSVSPASSMASRWPDAIGKRPRRRKARRNAPPPMRPPAPAAPPRRQRAPACVIRPAGSTARTMAEPPRPTLAFEEARAAAAALASFRGRPVLVNLWATWCGPCVVEMPSLDALAGRADGRQGLQIVAISQDIDGRRKVADFFAAHRFQPARALSRQPDAGDDRRSASIRCRPRSSTTARARRCGG